MQSSEERKPQPKTPGEFEGSAAQKRHYLDRRAQEVPNKGVLSGVQFTDEDLERMKRGETVAVYVGWDCYQYFGGPKMKDEDAKRLRLPNTKILGESMG